MIARGGATLALAVVAILAALVTTLPSSPTGSPASQSSSHPPIAQATGVSPSAGSAAAAAPAPVAGWIHEPITPSLAHWELYGSEAVYDPATGYVLAFGEQNSSQGLLPDYTVSCLNATWALEGNQWVNLSIPGPPVRCAALMGYDAAAGEVVLFGGSNYTTGQLSDTWTFAGGAWSKVDSLHRPNVTYEGMDSMTYDPELGCMVLVGTAAKVIDNVVWAEYYPTWEFCNGQWSVALTNGPDFSSSVGFGPSLGYDGSDGCAIAYREDPVTWANETYEFCPGGNWTLVSTALNVRVTGAGLAWDPALSGVVLFGGLGSPGRTSAALNETWIFSGGRWTQLAIDGPPGRGGAILTFDTQTNTLIMTGGYGIGSSGCAWHCNDTWELGPPAADITLSITVAPSEICVQSQPDCSAFTTSARVDLQLSVEPANASSESGTSSSGSRAAYGPFNWINAPDLNFLSYGAIQVASHPDIQEQCVDAVAGTSTCLTLPTLGSVGSRTSLVWSWSMSGANDSLHIGDAWGVQFNVSASGGPFTKVPVDACVTIGCEQAGSATWQGVFSSVSFGAFENSSVTSDSWPVGTVQVLVNPPSYTSPSPVAPGVPPGTGSPLPAPIGPAPVPVTVPIASAPSVLTSAGPSFTAAAAGILAAGGTRVMLRPRSMGQAMLARVSRVGAAGPTSPRIRGSD